MCWNSLPKWLPWSRHVSIVWQCSECRVQPLASGDIALFVAGHAFYFRNIVFHVSTRPPKFRVAHQPVLSTAHSTTAQQCYWVQVQLREAKHNDIILVGTFSEYCTLHSEHNQTSLTCLPEVPVWQCCYWSVAAPPTSGRPAGPGCSSAGLNSKCVFISTSTSKYWALAPHLALWQQNWEQYECYYATWIIAPLKAKFIDSKIDVA